MSNKLWNDYRGVDNAAYIHNKPVPIPTPSDDEKLLAYDSNTETFKYVPIVGDSVSIHGKSIPIPTDLNDGQVLIYDLATNSFIYADRGSLDTENAISIQGKSVPVPTSSDDQKVLAFDNATGAFKYVQQTASPLSESSLLHTAIGGEASFATPGNYVHNTDILQVYEEGVRLIRDVNYTLAADGSSITLNGYTATAGNEYIMYVLKGAALANATEIQSKPVPIPTSAEDGKALIYDNTTGAFVYGDSGGAKTFTELTDTPAAYTNEAGKYVAVKADATGLEFKAIPVDPIYQQQNLVSPASDGAVNIPIGIAGFDSTKDILAVYHENIRLYEGVNYNIAADDVSIDLLGFTALMTDKFMFYVIKGTALSADVTAVEQRVTTLEAKKQKHSVSFYIADVLAVETNAASFIVPFGMTIQKVKLAVDTAPVGSSILVDIHKNGTTIFTTQTNRPSIGDGALTGGSTTIEVPGLLEDDKLTLEIDQIGATTPGTNLSVTIVCLEA